MKKNLLLLGSICFVAILLLFDSGATVLFAHPGLQLKDFYGENIPGSNLPVSYQRSCGACHDVDFINIGYHFQMGRLETLPPEVYKKYHDLYGSPAFPFGLPPQQSDMSFPWFLFNPLYSTGGMYGRLSLQHLQKLAPYSTTDPLKLTFTTPDYATNVCNNCHAGGGFHVEDRMGNKLYDKDKTTIQDSLAKGEFLGDYLRYDKKTGTVIPDDWKAKAGDKTIPNIREIDCLLCHSRDYSFGAARNYLGKGMAAWAATAGARLGEINADGTVNYDKKRVENIHTMIGKTSNETCGRCHAGAYDIDGDGFITLNDNVAFNADKNLNNSPAYKKRAHEIGNTVKKINGVLQRVIDPSQKIKYYDLKLNNWQDVPYVDVHLERGLVCVDCHKPLGAEKNIKQPVHDFGKGTAGFNVRSDLSGTATCEQCHTAFDSEHRGIFGPPQATRTHLTKIHCTTCHIPQKFGIVGETILKDRSNDGKPDSFKNIAKLDGYGFVGVPAVPDYVYFPDKDANTGTYSLKIKPANVMSEIFWTTEDGMPVPDRLLAAAFKTASNTFSTDPSKPGPQTSFALSYYKDGSPLKMKNGIPVQREALAVYANGSIETPHYIASGMGVPDIAPIVGRVSQGAALFEKNIGKTGWVVARAGANQMYNLQTQESMIIRSDEKEWTIIDKKDEIVFAAKALESAYKKIHGQDVKVNYVYHLSILDGAFIMSHNVAPINSKNDDKAFARNSMHVLQCKDCHLPEGKFNRPVKVALQIDSVPGITQFEMPKPAIHGSQVSFTQSDMRALTYSYYLPLVSLMIADGNAVIKNAWSSVAGRTVDPLYENKTHALLDSSQKTLEIVNVSLIENEATLKVWANANTPASFDITVNPPESLKSKKYQGNILLVSLKKPKDSVMVEVAVVIKEDTSLEKQDRIKIE